MARSRYRILKPDAPHFLTCTVVNWTPLFTRPDSVQIVLDSFAYLQKERDLKLYGFVILENHLHWIAQSPDLHTDLTSFKSYTAKMLLRLLEQHRVGRLLREFAFRKKAHKTDRQHQLWEEGSHPQLIEHPEMLRQKLDYIHYNPVKRGYVDAPEDWRYSSARNYAGREGLVDVFTDWG